MTHLENIRKALGPELGKKFYGLVQTFGMRENDDSLVPLAGQAMMLERTAEMMTDLAELASTFSRMPSQVRAEIEGGVPRIEEGVERSVAVTMDLMSSEIRRLVRDVAISELTTAALIRSQAITDEVKALRREAESIAEERSVRSALPASSPEAGRGVLQRSIPWLGGAAVMGVLMTAINLLHHAPAVHHLSHVR